MMLWFQGSIPDAIKSAKQRSLVFVVVITGEDEQSAQLMSSWEDDRVSEAAQKCCVAIKVEAKRLLWLPLTVQQLKFTEVC
uniref:UBX domain protein 4 n=1 Tax=Oreochromis aureus TaxID=47969 RepID=A0A668TIC7_OREAU